jgi:hypothetical protein
MKLTLFVSASSPAVETYTYFKPNRDTYADATR